MESNLLALGALGIMAFIGSSRLNSDLGDRGRDLLDQFWVRKLIVFAIAYIYTRTLANALAITILYTFVVSVVLYEKEDIDAEFIGGVPYRPDVDVPDLEAATTATAAAADPWPPLGF